MWYFTWILGLGFALLLGLCNLLWLEARWEADERDEDKVGGWGIPLIRSLMDQFDYQRIGDINEITILRREREN